MAGLNQLEIETAYAWPSRPWSRDRVQIVDNAGNGRQLPSATRTVTLRCGKVTRLFPVVT
jgi:hypothetical protein